MLTVWVRCLLVGCVLSCASIARAQQRWYVDASLNSGGDSGASWADAFQGDSGLQAALAVATSGDEVWVADGTYLPSDSLDRSISFEPGDGVTVYGGFSGSELNLEDRDWRTNASIMSGDLAGDDLPDFGNRGDNSYHVVDVEVGVVVLDGLTIRGGIAQAEPGGLLVGGGIDISFGATVTARNCHIRDNEARNGGGVEIRGAGHLEHCVISGNRVTDTVFATGGGARSLVGFNTELATFANCLIFGNTATQGGGGVAADHSGFEMVNCTVVGNRVIDQMFGGGVMLEGTFGTLEISNAIIWGNSTAAGDSDELTQLWNPDLPSFLILNHTTVQGFTGTRQFAGSGNSGVDPRFVDQLGPDVIAGSGDEDYHLMGNSAVIDAGANSFVPAAITVDLDGLPRFSDVTTVPDTGTGAGAIVDLGAYEAQDGGPTIPTLSEWGLGLYALLLLAAGIWRVRKAAHH